MRPHWPRLVSFLYFAMLAMPVSAQGISWQQDLEAAKALARQTGRLVLVHFWTPECAPCVSLDQQVFNQPSVAGAIEAQFVPVKLNANEHPATAQGYGITRVPTDVVITPDGAVVGKLVSPPTPGAYVAEVTQVAGAYSSTLGAPFAHAVANAPTPSQINSAYANLNLAPNTPPAVTQPVAAPPAAPPAVSPPFAGQNGPPASTVSMTRTASAPLSAENQYAAPLASNVPPAAPPRYPAAASAPAPQPSQAANPYVAATMTLQPDVNRPSSLVPVAPTAPFAQQQQSAAPATPGAAPDPKQLPPGAPSLGFDGYCPVSMRNTWKWIPGDPQWGIVHRGRTYWFASQAEQQQFWADPDRYSPALSGMDPVMAIDHKQQVPGKREHSIDYDNLFYMFCSEATLQQFTANPERYAVGVREAMGIQRGRLVR